MTPGTLQRLSDAEFCRELHETLRQHVDAYVSMVVQMRDIFHSVPGNANPASG